MSKQKTLQELSVELGVSCEKILEKAKAKGHTGLLLAGSWTFIKPSTEKEIRGWFLAARPPYLIPRPDGTLPPLGQARKREDASVSFQVVAKPRPKSKNKGGAGKPCLSVDLPVSRPGKMYTLPVGAKKFQSNQARKEGSHKS